MSFESVMPSNHLTSSSCLQFFPALGSFPMSQLFTSGGQSIEAPASVLLMNIQGWFPFRFTGLISLQSKGLSSLFQHHDSKVSILWCSAFIMVQLSHPYVTARKSIAWLYRPLPAKWCLHFLICCLGCHLENSETDGNTRPPDLPLEKPICRSGSNS